MDPLSSADLSTGGLSQMSLIKADIMTKSKSFDDVQKLSEKNKNSNKDKRRHSGSDKNVNIDNNENDYAYDNENDNDNENDTIVNPMNRNILKKEIKLNTNNNNNDNNNSNNNLNNSFDDIDVQLTKRLSNADFEPYKKQNNLITSENKNNLNILKSLSTLRPFKNFQKYNLFPQKSTSETDLTSEFKKENISLSQQLSDKISNRVENGEENDENESLNDRGSSRERGRGSRDRGRDRDGDNDGDRDEDDVDDDEEEDEEQFSENLDDMSLERVSDDRGGRSNDESEDLTAFDNDNENENNDNDNDNDNDNYNSDNNSPVYNDRNTENDADTINVKSVNTESVKSPILSQKNLNNVSTGDIILSKFDKNSDLNVNNNIEEEGSIDQFKQNYEKEKFHENDGKVITDFENIYTENNDNLGENNDNKTEKISQKTVDEIRKLSNDGSSNKNERLENVTEKGFYAIGDVSDVSHQVKESIESTTHTQSTHDTEISIKTKNKIGVENDSKNTDLTIRESNKTNLTDLNIPNDIKVSRTYSIEDRTVPTAPPLAITKSRSTSSLRFQGEGTGTLKGIYAQGNQNVVLNATSKY